MKQSGIHYEGGTLQFVQTEHGRALPGAGADPVYSYEYTLTDHLGNGRVYFDIDGSNNARAVQSQDYYAFGMTIPGATVGSPENKYQYNGKEKQLDLFGQYDYGARFYDPVIGRWGAVDNSSENYYVQSPYSYSGNNPVLYKDFDGNDYGIEINRGGKQITIKATYISNAANASSLKKYGTDKWNEKSGKFVFVAGGAKALKNGKAEVYKINIELQTKVVDYQGEPNQSPGEKMALSDQTGILNSVDETSRFHNPKWGGTTGNNVIKIRKGKTGTGLMTHEISHSLGNAHIEDGGSLILDGGFHVDSHNIFDTLNGVGIGGNTVQRNANSRVGDGTLLNNSSVEGLESGELMTERRYKRLLKKK